MKGKRNHIIKPVERTVRPNGPVKAQKSRKGTKAWRKNIDIDEVTSGLERVRQQKIQGGVIAEKQNEQLFSVDTRGDRSVIQRERLGKTLRSDEILALKSAIQPVSGLAHKNSALGSGIVHKKKKGPLPASELLRLKKIANKVANASNGSNAIASIKKDTAKTYDVWDQPVEEEDSSEWVEPVRAKRPPTTYGQAPINLTTDGQAVPAIQVAESGQSYNPPIEEWNDLIERKAEAQQKLDEAQRLQNVKSRAAQGIDERFEENLGADGESEPEQTLSEDDAENEPSLSKKVAARATAKTQTQRNKEARKQRHIEIEAAIRARKAERKALASLGSLIEQNTDLSSSQKAEMLESVRSSGETMSTLRKHKFGKHQIPIDPLEIQLSDELAESFRTLKPEGNLFKDRFMSLVKRGIVEARIPQSKRRRYALLQKEKYSHKFDQGKPFMA